jgi:hypothetical protein
MSRLMNSNLSVSPSGNRPWYRHMGSTIAIVLGLVYFAGSLSPSNPSHDGSIAGPVMVLGALAYRSAKRRALGEATASMGRLVIETVLILLIVASVVFRNDLRTAIVINSAPTLLIPAWCVVAYVVAAVRAWKARETPKPAAKSQQRKVV